ncbi:hypothetical protein Tco_1031133 [Tanacetum coccineum]|uniref:Uncharacterized protein n=1 Tax=Tanacetum coccineum TaxID=301880 RepID=A0ABQ5GA49_9ASTR
MAAPSAGNSSHPPRNILRVNRPLARSQDHVPCMDNVKYCKKNSQKATRERMSDQEAKEIKAEAREIMPQSTAAKPQLGVSWNWMAAETPRVLELRVSI